jgi:hypothetical protein
VTKLEKFFSAVVIMIGSLSMLGTATSLDPVKGIGFMTTASPLPLVFSKFRGIENFSSDYYMDVKLKDGEIISIKITPEIYDRASGPYNRRNPYGAVLAYGPMLTAPHEMILRDRVMQYSACGKGSFMREIGITKPIEHINVTVKSKTVARPVWNFEVNCSSVDIAQGASNETL